MSPKPKNTAFQTDRAHWLPITVKEKGSPKYSIIQFYKGKETTLKA